MKIIKAIVAILFALDTIIICSVDADHSPLSHVLMIVASWLVTGLILNKMYKK